MGSPDFAVPSLGRLVEAGHQVVAVYTQPDRPAGRGRQLQPSPVKLAALQAGLEVHQPETLRTDAARETLLALRPDAIIVVAFGQILRPAILGIPPHGVINVHASLLPHHRGASPVAGALLAGDEVSGVTIMLLDAGLDTGPILAQRTEPILPEDTAGSLTDRLAVRGAEFLAETLPGWLTGSITPVPQDEAQATLTRRISKEAGRVDWNRAANETWRQIRAYTPWPGAMTSLNGTPVQILQSWAIASEMHKEPGAVLPLPESLDLPAALESPAFAVQTGNGLLLPLVLKRSGKRALNAQEFLNGERGLAGARFGT
jgi:methionyl-tRNA formyltransferase